METSKKILRLVPVVSILASLLVVSSSTTAAAGACWSPKPEEQQFRSAMNLARSANGESQLQLDPELSKAARLHTREMTAKDLLYHTPDSSLTNRVTHWSVLGENVGVGGTVDSLHDAFMNSSPHRANILYSQFRYVGIGVREAEGRMWVTVIFEASSDPGTRLPMPSC
ncbi:MAG TPA: CAP domain-containing protein [Actinomycetota bacterium]|nr:CAP domain-containing protein [Actinomycetota bacterium]